MLLPLSFNQSLHVGILLTQVSLLFEDGRYLTLAMAHEWLLVEWGLLFEGGIFVRKCSKKSVRRDCIIQLMLFIMAISFTHYSNPIHYAYRFLSYQFHRADQMPSPYALYMYQPQSLHVRTASSYLNYAKYT